MFKFQQLIIRSVRIGKKGAEKKNACLLIFRKSEFLIGRRIFFCSIHQTEEPEIKKTIWPYSG